MWPSSLGACPCGKAIGGAERGGGVGWERGKMGGKGEEGREGERDGGKGEESSVF
jgi:hypothetical protein